MRTPQLREPHLQARKLLSSEREMRRRSQGLNVFGIVAVAAVCSACASETGSTPAENSYAEDCESAADFETRRLAFIESMAAVEGPATNPVDRLVYTTVTGRLADRILSGAWSAPQLAGPQINDLWILDVGPGRGVGTVDLLAPGYRPGRVVAIDTLLVNGMTQFRDAEGRQVFFNLNLSVDDRKLLKVIKFPESRGGYDIVLSTYSVFYLRFQEIYKGLKQQLQKRESLSSAAFDAMIDADPSILWKRNPDRALDNAFKNTKELLKVGGQLRVAALDPEMVKPFLAWAARFDFQPIADIATEPEQTIPSAEQNFQSTLAFMTEQGLGNDPAATLVRTFVNDVTTYRAVRALRDQPEAQVALYRQTFDSQYRNPVRWREQSVLLKLTRK